MSIKRIAVDCGWGGAVAIETEEEVFVHDCPGDSLGIIFLLRDIKEKYGKDGWEAILEFNSASPTFGARGNFGLGMNIGCWKASLEAEEIPYETVTPKDWQRITSKERSSTKKGRKMRKEKSWRFARRKWPELAKELGEKVPSVRGPQQGRADALCILYYFRRK